MPTLRTVVLLGALLALAAPPVAAQLTSDQLLERCRDGYRRGTDVRHCEVRESRLPAGALRLDGGAMGGVTVRAHQGREIVVRAVVESRAASAGRARELAQGVQVRTDGTVRATGRDAGTNEGWWVSYDVLVPARTDLELQARNGPVSVSGVSGTMRLRTQNGPVRLENVSGDVRASAQNGPVDVRLAGSRWNGTGLVAETVNGPVTVRMPSGYAARIEGETTRGPIHTDLPIRGSGRSWERRTIATDVNGGGPTLRFTTVNGPLTIRRS
jgi:hypothetical protein